MEAQSQSKEVQCAYMREYLLQYQELHTVSKEGSSITVTHTKSILKFLSHSHNIHIHVMTFMVSNITYPDSWTRAL